LDLGTWIWRKPTDIYFGEDVQLLKQTFRAFLAKECPMRLVRAVEDEGLAYSASLYAALAELGWLGLPLPAAYGGQGGHLLHLGLLFEELGRALAPVPYLSSIVLSGLLIAAAGTPDQQAEWLPALASGQRVATPAWLEADDGSSLAELATTAHRDANGLRLSGRKRFVRYAEAADVFLVSARLDDQAGPVVLLVSAGTPGLRMETYPIMNGERLSDLIFWDCQLPASAVLGDGAIGPALLRVLNIARAMLACEMIGGAEALLDRTVRHVQQRHTFGRPIGANQAIQHRLARLKMQLDGARLLARKAAWFCGEELPAGEVAAAAKVAASAVYRLAANEAVQMHGGYGVAKDYDIQLYWRRHKALEIFLGDSQLLRAELAASWSCDA
jgi:alkylation response protein AidB-like acyl-CoA dehydrogenase